MSNFAKATIKEFAAFRQMLIAGRKPKPNIATPPCSVSPAAGLGRTSATAGRTPIPRSPLLSQAVSPSTVSPDAVGGHLFEHPNVPVSSGLAARSD
jgi:hypothetical protein